MKRIPLFMDTDRKVLEVQIQKLENTEELDALVRGDLIETQGDKIMLGAYHQKNYMGQHEFLFPAELRGEYIIMDRVRSSKIQIVDGRIVYNRDCCAIQSFTPERNFTEYDYGELNETLRMSGLR